MDLLVNDEKLAVADDISVQQLLDQIGSPKQGVAVAVNDTLLPKSDWDGYAFKPNDNVLVIKAHSGG